MNTSCEESTGCGAQSTQIDQRINIDEGALLEVSFARHSWTPRYPLTSHLYLSGQTLSTLPRASHHALFQRHSFLAIGACCTREACTSFDASRRHARRWQIHRQDQAWRRGRSSRQHNYQSVLGSRVRLCKCLSPCGPCILGVAEERSNGHVIELN